MKYNEVKYEYKVNLGDYNSEMLGISSSIQEGEDVGNCIIEVMNIIRGSLGVKLIEKSVKAEVTSEPTLEIKEEKKTKAKKEKAVEAPVVEEKAVEAPVVEEKVVDSPATGAAKEEAVVEESVKKPTRKLKSKTSIYDRSNDIHKKLIGEILDKENPGWRAAPGKAKAASVALEGKDFLDDEGLVLTSFRDLLKEEMK